MLPAKSRASAAVVEFKFMKSRCEWNYVDRVWMMSGGK